MNDHFTRIVNPNELKELEEARVKFLKIKKCKQILKELFFNLFLIFALFLVSYSNLNSSAFHYRKQIELTFSSFNDV